MSPPICAAFGGFRAAGTDVRNRVDTTHDPLRAWGGGVALSSKTTLALFGSMGQSSRSVGLASGQHVYAQGWECGKVRDSGKGKRTERGGMGGGR